MHDNLLLTFHEIGETARRHFKKLFAFNLLVLMFAIAIIIFWPRKYGSEAKLWLKIGRENSHIDPTAATGKTVHITESGREDEVKSVLDVICSRGVISAVVDKLTPEVVLGNVPLAGGEPAVEGEGSTGGFRNALGSVFGLVGKISGSIDPVSDKERAIREMSENVYADAARRSNVIKVHYASESPALSQVVLQELIKEYRIQHTRIHHTSGSLEFFDAQAQQLQAHVNETAEELTNLMKEINVASIEGQRQNLEAERLQVETAKFNTRSDFSKANALVTELTAQLADHPEYIKSEEKSVPNTGRDELQKALYDLQVQRMQLEAKHAPNHPDVRRVRAQEKAAVAKLKEETTESRNEVSQAINSIHQTLALDLAKAQADRAANIATYKSILKQEEELKDEIAKLNEADIAIRQKQRELTLAEENYMSYAKNVEDARVHEALQNSAISNIAIAQEPTLQERPVSPSKGMVASLSLAGMFFGTIFLLGYYQTRDAARFSKELSQIAEDRQLSMEEALKLSRHNMQLLVLRGTDSKDSSEPREISQTNGNGKAHIKSESKSS